MTGRRKKVLLLFTTGPGIVKRRTMTANPPPPPYPFLFAPPLVSDDGGSSSEILRVLGGPSIGDIRSRLIRLIPRTNTSSQSTPILTPIPDAQSNLSRDSRYPHHYDEVGRGGEQAERARGIQAVHDLFGHRFDATCSEREARDRWMELVEGRSRLWEGVPEDRKECIRCEFRLGELSFSSVCLLYDRLFLYPIIFGFFQLCSREAQWGLTRF